MDAGAARETNEAAWSAADARRSKDTFLLDFWRKENLGRRYGGSSDDADQMGSGASSDDYPSVRRPPFPRGPLQEPRKGGWSGHGRIGIAHTIIVQDPSPRVSTGWRPSLLNFDG